MRVLISQLNRDSNQGEFFAW